MHVGRDSLKSQRDASSLYYMHIKMTYIRLVISLYSLKVKYFWKDLIINCYRRVATLSTVSLQHLFKLFCNLHETNIHAFFPRTCTSHKSFCIPMQHWNQFTLSRPMTVMFKRVSVNLSFSNKTRSQHCTANGIFLTRHAVQWRICTSWCVNMMAPGLRDLQRRMETKLFKLASPAACMNNHHILMWLWHL